MLLHKLPRIVADTIHSLDKLSICIPVYCIFTPVSSILKTESGITLLFQYITNSSQDGRVHKLSLSKTVLVFLQ